MKRIVALALCAASLGAAAQLPNYVPTDGLAAWYPLNGDAQEAIHDSLNGVISTSPSLVVVNRFGQQGGALGFLRQEQTQVVLPPLLDFSDSTFTFSGWFKSTALVPSQMIINTIPHNILGLNYNHGYNPDARHVSLWLNDDNICCWDISFNGHSDQSFALDAWHHVVVRRNGDAISLFVNGELDWSLTLDNNIGSPLEGLVLGSLNGGEYFNGSLDDFGFWQRALTDEEILALFNAPSPTTGCLDENACNYDSTAVIDDGSCHFLCEYCIDGTIWNEELQGCVHGQSADINNDGCVQLNDLLDLLSAYGDCGAEESPWQCGDPLEYQGYEYATVQIGEQCWFAENLRAENYSNGEQIPADLTDAEWLSTTSGASAVYGNDILFLEENGRFYNNFAIKDSRAICPAGWGVPDISQFPGLENWPNETFSGYKNAFDNASIYLGINEVSFYWSRAESDEGLGLAADTHIDNTDFIVNDHDFNFGFSVRCIKDAE